MKQDEAFLISAVPFKHKNWHCITQEEGAPWRASLQFDPMDMKKIQIQTRLRFYRNVRV
jgi:hypothetical protein